jgi:Uncharacterized protein conserved in bacteria (DUF2066)
MLAGTARFLCVALLGGCALLLPRSAGAASPDEVYTVGNYPVDAQAANAVAAKDQALADGQQAAFRSLLKRLVPVTDYDRLKRFAALKSGDFLEGVSVRSERNSRTRYIASLDFSFRADSVRAVLQQEGLPFVEEQAREIIVVPVVRDAAGTGVDVTATHTWTEAWKGLDLEHTLTPVELAALKPEINADTLKLLIDGKGANRVLADQYGRPYVVVAIAETDPATKRFNVTLAGIDAVGTLYLKRSYRVDNGDTGYAMELAAVVSQGVLEGRWKVIKAGAKEAARGEAVSLQARYQSYSEWREMRQQLLGVPGIADMRIESESAQSASLTLRYPGGPAGLAGALSAHGLTIESGASGLIVRSSDQP